MWIIENGFAGKLQIFKDEEYLGNNKTTEQ
jgi:hypothetical protein